MNRLKRLIYIVEDEELQSEMIKDTILEVSKEYPIDPTFRVFKNAKDALTACTIEPPDLMTLDLMLDNSNGLEVLKRVHNDLKLSFPIILISASIDDKSILDICPHGNACRSSGLSICASTVYKLPKPYDLKFFEILVRKIIL